MSDTVEIIVTGAGLWTAGFPDAAAWLAGVADPEAVKPSGALLDRRSRRRASPLIRAFADVFGQAVAGSGVDASVVPAIFGSALGEARTMIGLLDQMWREREALSPTAFAMSVHNAASGAISIASKNHGFTTSLAADWDTPAMALIEALGVAAAGGQPVVVACADEASPADLVPDSERFEMLASAIVVALPDAVGDAPVLARLRGPLRGTPDAPGADVPGVLARNPQIGLFDLADAVLRGRVGTLRLDRGHGDGWCVEVLPPGPA